MSTRATAIDLTGAAYFMDWSEKAKVEFCCLTIEKLRRKQYLLPPHLETRFLTQHCEELRAYTVKAYVDPLAGFLLRRSGVTTCLVAKNILWFLYPSYHLGDKLVETLWKELDRKVFEEEGGGGGGIKSDDV